MSETSFLVSTYDSSRALKNISEASFVLLVQTEMIKVSEAEMREMLALETKFSVEEILLYRSVAR